MARGERIGVPVAGLIALLAVTCARGGDCPGDLDGDGLVTSTDLNLILASFGCTGSVGCSGDADGDGDVDTADLNFLLATFGDDCDSPCGNGDAVGCCAPQATPGCGDEGCCEAVCAADPLCCAEAWDVSCVELAQTSCGLCGPGACCLSRGGCLTIEVDLCLSLSGVFQGGGVQCVDVFCSEVPTCGVVGAGPCCAVSSTPSCQDAECCELVCTGDPFCCEQAWDEACADAALAGCAFCGQTSRWYVDYQNGDDANDGLSWESAFATNTHLLSVLADYDVAYFRGQFRADDQEEFAGYTGVTLIGDPGYDFDGEGNAWVGRQALLLEPDGWAEAFPGVYTQALEPDLPIQGVVQDWDTTTLADIGFPETHAGHLPGASDETLADGWWFYDAPAGSLFVRTWEGDHPSGHEIEYILDGHAIAIISCDDCTLRNFAGKLATRFGNGIGGYGIRSQASINSTFEDCRVYDSGDHAVGIAGPKSVNNVVRRIEAYGQTHAPDGTRPSILFVFAGFDIDGGGDRAIDCYASPTPLLRPDGTPLFSLDQWNGQFGLAHGGTDTTQVDTEWRRCVYDCRAFQAVKGGNWDINEHRQGFVSGAINAEGFDPEDPDTYPTRTYDCRIIQAYQFSAGGAVAHERLSASIDASGLTTSAGGLAFQNSNSMQYFDYSIIVGSVETGNTTYGNAFIRAKTNVTCEIRARNSLFAIETDSAFPNALNKSDGSFVAGGKPAKVFADRCVFVRTGSPTTEGPHFVSLSNTPVLGAHVGFTDCWYTAFGGDGSLALFDAPQFAKGLTLDGLTPLEGEEQWSRFVDPTGVYATDPELIGGWPIEGLDPALTEPGEGSPLRSPRFKLEPRPGAMGINGQPDDGTIGPWQYGGVAPSATR